ncbi:hypothetical protein C8F04DRAFT_1197198 [Mycena alexandri]|uniref:Uncharacterized protein n=1 Tax=Mycena alexandri TaxID=1745969 RepID=A0AAD6S441_9AGAR|nr:hypothetical protein C8F04DRAFT_1197198 [Mycena alexandri]
MGSRQNKGEYLRPGVELTSIGGAGMYTDIASSHTNLRMFREPLDKATQRDANVAITTYRNRNGGCQQGMRTEGNRNSTAEKRVRLTFSDRGHEPPRIRYSLWGRSRDPRVGHVPSASHSDTSAAEWRATTHEAVVHEEVERVESRLILLPSVGTDNQKFRASRRSRVRFIRFLFAKKKDTNPGKNTRSVRRRDHTAQVRQTHDATLSFTSWGSVAAAMSSKEARQSNSGGGLVKQCLTSKRKKKEEKKQSLQQNRCWRTATPHAHGF